MDAVSGGPLQHARRELLESILAFWGLFSQLFFAFQTFLACEAGWHAPSSDWNGHIVSLTLLLLLLLLGSSYFARKNRHGWYSFTFKFSVDFDVAMLAILGSSSHANLLTFQEETPGFAISPSTHSTRSTPLSLSLSLSLWSLELSSSASGDAASLPELWRIPHLHPSFSIFPA